MKIKLGYGTGFQSAEVPEKNILKILEPNSISYKGKLADIVKDALAKPIGTPALRDIVKPGEKIAIITSDITRPMPTWDVIPHVLDELYAADVKAEDVTLVFALGSHRAHTEEEKKKLAGERAFSEIKCVDSNPDDCIHMGNTSKGTPIDITRVVAEADRRICLGNIEYHYFAGYSGGIKALMPGASTPAAIQANHSMMVNENACAGKLDGNPLREDLEEAAELCPIDFIVNVVLDEHKQIVHAVAGDVKKAHRSGCAFLDSLYKVQIPQRADIVLVSQGGAPKDLNLYQTQKALDNSKHAVRNGGTIILVGACQEGLGQKVFEEWITEAEKPADLISRVRENFRLGGHKAAAIAMVMERADIKLVSEMDKDFVESIFFEPYSELQSAVDDALAKHGNDASIIVMPYGGSTLPVE
ncbi:MAG: nickel-dependent lactate racemase [Bacillota bacterium]|nr:nickel-dependent lactate racemase [Bacillota bacterium]